jgi:hypothetical protein
MLRLLKLNAEAMSAVRYSVQPRLKLEVALVGMMSMDSVVRISDLLERLGSVSIPRGGGAPPALERPRGYTSARGGTSRSDSPDSGHGETAIARSGKQANEITAAHDTRSGSNAVSQQSELLHPIVKMLMDGLDAELLPPKNG